MGILYYPSPGEVLLCKYDRETVEPEICKPRPCVVVGARLRRRGRLVTVVPLSTIEPNPIEGYHVRLEFPVPLPAPFEAPVSWAKCDLVSSVSVDRLDRFKNPYQRGGGRTWRTGRVTDDELAAIRAAMLTALSLQP